MATVGVVPSVGLVPSVGVYGSLHGNIDTVFAVAYDYIKLLKKVCNIFM